MSTKVQFIREFHNNKKIEKKTLKRCKKNNKIQIDKNIKVQDKQQKTNLEWNLIYDYL
jgi:hypothetical protein